jgi:methylenetetrahydrofolate dehydrogenase (NADP+) / methenyltetrahydrofolate cyclohydrolase
MDGRALAARVREEVADGVRKLGGVGLATILVGDDPASDIYITLKQKAAREVGMNAVDKRLPAEITQEELLEVVAGLNDDDEIDGLLVQSPLPSHLDETATIEALDPAKDVDGLHPVSAGLLALGRPRLVGATPLGIMRLLEEFGIEPSAKNAVVVGRSNIVGKPVAQLLLQANATVTICHSRTADLAHQTLDADILVAATGVLHLISPDMVKTDSTVIDVGMNRTEEGLFGDVDPGAMERAAFMTPVPGGVGPMTIAMVLRNAVRAAELRRGSLALPR